MNIWITFPSRYFMFCPDTTHDALVNPAIIRQSMFGATVVSDRKEESPIVWKGEWEGRLYEDKGTILRLEPERILQFSGISVPFQALPIRPKITTPSPSKLGGDADRSEEGLVKSPIPSIRYSNQKECIQFRFKPMNHG